MLVRLGCPAFWLFVCLVVSPASADTEGERATPKGLAAVAVLIENIKPEVEREGLSRATLQTDVELRLRQSGIRVQGGSFIYIRVNTLHTSTGLYAVSITTELLQAVFLARDPKVSTLAATWSASGDIGIVGPAILATATREKVRDQIDQFINAYLAENPKR